jgi:hypothetical protein
MSSHITAPVTRPVIPTTAVAICFAVATARAMAGAGPPTSGTADSGDNPWG